MYVHKNHGNARFHESGKKKYAGQKNPAIFGVACLIGQERKRQTDIDTDRQDRKTDGQTQVQTRQRDRQAIDGNKRECCYYRLHNETRSATHTCCLLV